jgi:hypothetical protein
VDLHRYRFRSGLEPQHATLKPAASLNVHWTTFAGYCSNRRWRRSLARLFRLLYCVNLSLRVCLARLVHHQHEHSYPVDLYRKHSHPHPHETITHAHEHHPDAHHQHRHDPDCPLGCSLEALVSISCASVSAMDEETIRKTTSLPLNGRSYTDLLAIQPGVAPISTLLPNSVRWVSA